MGSNIGNKGCFYISAAKWPKLTIVELCTIIYTKRRTKLERRDAVIL